MGVGALGAALGGDQPDRTPSSQPSPTAMPKVTTIGESASTA